MYKTVYQEIVNYSPLFDCNVCRLSVAGPNGAEYFTIVPKPKKSSEWRKLKEDILCKIESVIEIQVRKNCIQPGEVKYP